MKIDYSKIFKDIITFTPTVFEDNRGVFYESYNSQISDLLNVEFVQENHSISKKNVIRGLHYQWEKPTGKLVRCVRGTLIDYVVDIRKDSPTFGKYDSFILSDINKTSVWIPPGFAHGFLSLDDDTHLLYKCTATYNKDGEGSINPFDDDIFIYYPVSKLQSILSDKDRGAQSLSDYLKSPKF